MAILGGGLAGGGVISGVTVTGTGAAGKVVTASSSSAGTWAFPPGWELDYVSTVVDLTVSATTSAGAQTYITGNSTTFDGTRCKFEVFIPVIVATLTDIIVTLWEDGVDLGGRIAQLSAGTGTIKGEYFKTPSAGSHTYLIKAYRGGANGSLLGSLGFPSWYRITKA